MLAFNLAGRESWTKTNMAEAHYWQRNLYAQISTEQLPDCVELCLPVSKSWATLWWLGSYAYQYMPNSWFHHIPILDVNFSNSNIPWLAPKRCPRPPPPRRRWPWFSLPWPPLREQEQNRSFWVNYTPSFIRVWYFVCFVFGLFMPAGWKTKHTNVLPQADERRCK